MSSIRNCTQDCFELFSQLLEELPVQPDAHRAHDRVAVETHLFRFRLWAEHNSALSERHDSLDWRLRKSTVAHSVMVDLLTDLSQAIPIQTDDADVSAGSMQSSVDAALDRILRYSRAVRRSSGLGRIAKATDYVEYSETDPRKNLSAEFRDLAKNYLDTVALRDAAEYVKARLLETVCIRQRSFAFQRSRQEDKAMPSSEDPPRNADTSSRITSQVGSVVNVRTSSGISRRQSQPTLGGASKSGKRGIAPSAATTLASELVPSIEIHPEPIGIAFNLNDLPPQPKINQEQKEQECPYCFDLCPIEEFTDSSWPRHIIGDLMPFVCTVEVCSKPNILYGSEVAWLTHMRTDHAEKGWTCMHPDHDDPLLFVDRTDFFNHITEGHDDRMSSEEFESVAEGCFSNLESHKMFDRCPFHCDVDTSDFSSNALIAHVATHLIMLSQISLSGHDMAPEIELVSSTDVTSRPESLEIQGNDSRSISNVNAAQDDRSKFPPGDDHRDMSESLSNTQSDQWSEMNLPMPWTPELEAWTEAGHWNFIRDKVLPAYSHDTDPVLQHFMKTQSGEDLDSVHDDSDDDISEENRDSLRQALIGQLKHSAFDKTPHDFLPEGNLMSYITAEVISQGLFTLSSSPEEAELVQFALHRARKILAIVILSGLRKPRKVMRWFKSKDLDDTRLPLSKETLGNAIPLDFVTSQWAFCAPVFSLSSYIQPDLHQSSILPFLSKSTAESHDASSVVSQYVIHKNHFDPALSDHGVFAVKEIKFTSTEQEGSSLWKQQVEALQHINGLDEEHVLRFFTAFSRYEKDRDMEHYLIFEWADGGNLRSLWRATSMPVLTALLVRDVVIQFHGLVKALEAVHYSSDKGVIYGHGNLKPENLLLFKQGGSIGTLKLGDWGDAKGPDQRTELRQRSTAAMYSPHRYEPPEIETQVMVSYPGQSDYQHSRYHDVWSIGCIFLECLIWLLYGANGLDQFDQDLGHASFFQLSVATGQKEPRVHDVVVYWIDHMSKDSRCITHLTALGDLLTLVSDALIVVNLPPPEDANDNTQAARYKDQSGIDRIVPSERSRSPVNKLRALLENILGEDGQENYWHTPGIDGLPQPEQYYDRLDPSFHMRTGVEARQFFKKGRVFAMLYSEPVGETARYDPNSDAYTAVRFGASVFTSIRRFVVISVRRGFVYACAIATYGGQGTLKRGCNPAEHAVVCNTDVDPMTCLLPGEYLSKEAVQVIPPDQADHRSRLSSASRLRFGKAYTIEWNVKVKDIGMVTAGDMAKLLQYYNDEDREI